MECECGCGEKASTRSFKPGHDQKLRISLEHRAGGIIGLRKLVEAAERFSSGQVDSTALAKAVEAIFKK